MSEDSYVGFGDLYKVLLKVRESIEENDFKLASKWLEKYSEMNTKVYSINLDNFSQIFDQCYVSYSMSINNSDNEVFISEGDRLFNIATKELKKRKQEEKRIISTLYGYANIFRKYISKNKPEMVIEMKSEFWNLYNQVSTMNFEPKSKVYSSEEYPIMINIFQLLSTIYGTYIDYLMIKDSGVDKKDDGGLVEKINSQLNENFNKLTGFVKKLN